jgi:surface protein
MFYNCKNLISIDLSNFDISKVTNMNKLFYNCQNLKFINLFNFTDKEILSKIDMFYGVPENTKIYINNNEATSIYNLTNNVIYSNITRRLEQSDYTWLDNTQTNKENTYTWIDNSQTNKESTETLFDSAYAQREKIGTEKFITNFFSSIINSEYVEIFYDIFQESITTILDSSYFYSDEELSSSILITENSENPIECYISCEECNEEGNYTKHNCLSCKNDYS